ncbi:MAG: LPS export ABC transporter periplasmic protein LptC [Arcicella sp.]|nr:LPS export ABC transporter periplasmic protein LptC [Arcicella sp.]
MVKSFKKYRSKKSIARDFNPSLLIFEDVSPNAVVSVFTDHLPVFSKNPFLLFFSVFCLLLSACEDDKKEVKKQQYPGPISEVYGINMAYTDSAKLVVKMSTEAQLTMANEDKKYPKEVRIFFFDKMGNNTTKLRGDSAVYIKQTNLYRIMGRVQINNQVKNEVLETDELFWSPDTRKIYSNKAVDIKTPDQTIHGVGMDSNQDFTQYTIRRISNSQVSVKNLPQ